MNWVKEISSWNIFQTQVMENKFEQLSSTEKMNQHRIYHEVT